MLSHEVSKANKHVRKFKHDINRARALPAQPPPLTLEDSFLYYLTSDAGVNLGAYSSVCI